MHSANHAFVGRMLLLLAIAGMVSLDAMAQKKGGGSPAASSSPASASPSASGASASNAPVEVEWLAYSALDRILQKVADFSCNSHTHNFRVVILDPPSLQALQAYDSFYAQAESLNSTFVDMAPKSGAGGGIDDFADITGAVSAAAVATTSETSYNFTVQDPTAAIVLLSKLHQKTKSEGCKKAYYAGVYGVSDVTTAQTTALVYKANPQEGKETVPKELPSVLQELANLAITRAEVLRSILALPGAPVNPRTCKATATAVQGAPAGTTAVSSQDPCVSAFNNLDGTYNSFLTALSTPNSTTGQPAVSSAKQGYRLRALLQTASPTKPVLGIYLSVAAAGGTQQDRKNLLTALFTGDWIRYSGGVSVNVIVFEVAGKQSQILFSDLVRYRTPLTKIKAPSDDKELNKGDNLDVFPKVGAAPVPIPDQTENPAQPAVPLEPGAAVPNPQPQ